MFKLLISGEIGWDVTPYSISRQLDEANGKDLDVHIASPGGYVSDGIEIFNMFRDYKRKFPESQMMATIKGVAASMATYLAVNPAFDLIAAEDNAVFMIHNVWGGTVGDYREMLKTAEVFQGLTGIIADAYVNKTGISKNKIKNMMDDESWFFGSEIQESGFVDEIIKTDDSLDPAQSMAHAKLKFKNLSEKLKKENSQTSKIAAMIKPEKEKNLIDALEYDENAVNRGIEQAKKDYSGDLLNMHPKTEIKKTAQNPASAGKNITEVTPMETLMDLMAVNPAAKIELENLLNKKGEDQFEAGKQSVLTVAKKAAAFASNKEYHETIRNYAVGVMSGENSMETLDALVVHADMTKETAASSSAKDETEKLGSTPGEQTPAISADGTVSSPADLDAEIARTKNANGVEVI